MKLPGKPLALLLSTAMIFLCCRTNRLAGAEKAWKRCGDDNEFSEREVPGPRLDFIGDVKPSRVLFQYAKGETMPTFVKLEFPGADPVLVAPDRVILRIEGSLRPKDISQRIANELSPPPELQNALRIEQLGGETWLISLPFGLNPPEELYELPGPKKAFSRAPGVALVAALRSQLRDKGHLFKDLHIRGIDFDRLVKVKLEALPSDLSAPSGPCLKKQGALRFKYDVPGWWTGPKRVAVVDSGIAKHGDLQVHWPSAVDTSIYSRIELGNVNTKACEVACDDKGHGTQVAGVVASKWGVAPNATLVPVKVFAGGCGWSSSIISGIYEAAKKADLVVLAWTFRAPSKPQCMKNDLPADEICHAIKSSEDTLFLTAAGNGNFTLEEHLIYPAGWASELSNLLAVGGVDSQDTWTGNRGPTAIGVAGAAGRCKTTMRKGAYGVSGGTSLAVGYAAGAAALYWAQPQNSNKSPREVKRELAKTARGHGSNSPYKKCCDKCGVLDVSNLLGYGPTTIPSNETTKCP